MGNFQQTAAETQENVQYSKVYHHHSFGLTIFISNEIVGTEKKWNEDGFQNSAKQMPTLSLSKLFGHHWNVDSVH